MLLAKSHIKVSAHPLGAACGEVDRITLLVLLRTRLQRLQHGGNALARERGDVHGAQLRVELVEHERHRARERADVRLLLVERCLEGLAVRHPLVGKVGGEHVGLVEDEEERQAELVED